MNRHISAIVAAVCLTMPAALLSTAAQSPPKAQAVPQFRPDPSWPSIPNNWVLGEVSSIAVDSQDHIWILHRPATIPEAQHNNAAPPVLEFDATGKFIRSWGGPGAGYEWPQREHGIYVDPKNNVWIGGN